ncbi:MAG: radical SAM family heme chaperone HemW [Rikenellaceae bacterium]|nr:radical SAM family heme chaperone HemW [Rikenellaceae bacterium]MCL2692557.1 radical SAM family heme chaperone HemW [Rikenellaceae bacterium]
MAGIYVHIPFCRRRCGYCDFYSCTRTELRESVLGEIACELEEERDFIGRNAHVETIYFGGGTPTVCSTQQLQAIIESVERLWGCAATLGEITVEANPDDLTPEYLRTLTATRVNRLSIGVQSFSDRDLRLMERRHTAAAAVTALHEAQRVGFRNITIDLIYGIPGMSLGEWTANIETALSLGVQHISAYILTIEEGTPFGHLAKKGQLALPSEEAVEEQFTALRAMLSGAGFEHYEISNFALPGFRARHNSAYWTGEPYLGVGPSAHSFDGRTRRSCAPSVERYLADRRSCYVYETLSAADRHNELIMTSLRTAAGIDARALPPESAARFDKLAAGGLLILRDGRYFIPAEKYLVSDAIISELFISVSS